MACGMHYCMSEVCEYATAVANRQSSNKQARCHIMLDIPLSFCCRYAAVGSAAYDCVGQLSARSSDASADVINRLVLITHILHSHADRQTDRHTHTFSERGHTRG